MTKKEHINQILELVDRSRIPVKRTVDFSLLRTLLNEAIPEPLNIDSVSQQRELLIAYELRNIEHPNIVDKEVAKKQVQEHLSNL